MVNEANPLNTKSLCTHQCRGEPDERTHCLNHSDRNFKDNPLVPLGIIVVVVALIVVACCATPVPVPDPAHAFKLEISAYYTQDTEDTTRTGHLCVVAKVSPGWHTYSITQPVGGPSRTRITVDQNMMFHVGKFTPDHLPKSHVSDGVLIEEHEGTVVWSAPIEYWDYLPEIRGIVVAQVCSNTSCSPPTEYEFTAKKKANATVRGT